MEWGLKGGIIVGKSSAQLVVGLATLRMLARLLHDYTNSSPKWPLLNKGKQQWQILLTKL